MERISDNFYLLISFVDALALLWFWKLNWSGNPNLMSSLEVPKRTFPMLLGILFEIEGNFTNPVFVTQTFWIEIPNPLFSKKNPKPELNVYFVQRI